MATLAELQSVLKPIEEADESKQDFKSRLKLKNHLNFDQRNNDREKTGDPCKKLGHNHNWKDCPNNKYSSKYKGKESHANKERQGDSS